MAMNIQPIIPLPIVLPAMLAVYGAVIFRVLRRKDRLREKLLTLLRLLGIGCLVFVINLRVMKESYDTDVEMKNIDVLFVTDTTISMWAEDYSGNRPRMEGVQESLTYIMEELYGGSFALIRFDNRSQILAPFTQDADTVGDALDTISAPDRYYARGSSLNTALDDMEKLLQSSAKKDNRKTYLFFVSDGEITDGSSLTSFRELMPLVDGGAVLGFGTAEGGRMYDGRYYSYVVDPETWDDAVSCIDEDNLRQIASDLGIEYIHMTSKQNVRAACSAIRADSSAVRGKGDTVVYEDTYYMYALPLLALLVWEAWVIVRKKRV